MINQIYNASDVNNSSSTRTLAHETRKNKQWLSMFAVAALIVSAAFITSCGNDDDDSIPVTSVTLDKSALSLTLGGGEATLNATVLPAEATNKKVTWSSSSTGVVTVTNGVVTAVSVGEATITVTTEDGGKEATCTVTVGPNEVAVTGVTLDESEIELEIDDTFTLVQTVAPENATNNSVTWESNNPVVATVEDGVVTAVSAGTAIITVTTNSGGKQATCTVKVIETVNDFIIEAILADYDDEPLYEYADNVAMMFYTIWPYEIVLGVSDLGADGSFTVDLTGVTVDDGYLYSWENMVVSGLPGISQLTGSTVTVTPSNAKMMKSFYFKIRDDDDSDFFDLECSGEDEDSEYQYELFIIYSDRNVKIKGEYSYKPNSLVTDHCNWDVELKKGFNYVYSKIKYGYDRYTYYRSALTPEEENIPEWKRSY